jgi:hypothetical protein
MIEIFEGRIGGGKSYHAVERICKYLAAGGVVATNITLNWEGVCRYCRARWGVDPDREQWVEVVEEQIHVFHRHVPKGTKDKPTLVVIDEAHAYFNSRDWSQANREFLWFLTQSRKAFIDVIFISQSANNIDKQLRALFSYLWRFRDLRTWKIPVLGMRYPFDQFLSVQYDQDGKSELVRRFAFKDRLLYGAYDTFQLVRAFPTLDAKVTNGPRKVRRVPMKWLMLVLAVVAGSAVWHFWRDGAPWDRGGKEVAATSGAKVVPGSVARAPARDARSVFRVLAYMGGSDVGAAKLYTSHGTFELGGSCPWGRVVGVSAAGMRIEGGGGELVEVLDGGTVPERKLEI